MKIACPFCQSSYEVTDDCSGCKVECAVCGKKFRAGDPPSPADAATKNRPVAEKSDGKTDAPSDFWPATVISAECAVGIIVTSVLAIIVCWGGETSELVWIAIVVGSFVVAAPLLCFAAIADRLHKIEWYIRKEYQFRHKR